MQALFKMSNLFLNIVSRGVILAKDKYKWPEGTPEWIQGTLDPIMKVLSDLIPILLILMTTAGSIYAIILGVNYSRAETSDKREEAKKRLINFVIGIVAILVLLFLLMLLADNIDSIVTGLGSFGRENTTT